VAPRAHWPALYAESGIWYDAIDDLSRLISAEPDNRRLREQRAALLEQVGLREAAEFDRAAGR
jgi:Flp pilus assembly protein TadD